jgi:hypothetical protein
LETYYILLSYVPPGIIFDHYASIRKYTKLINSNCESGGEIEISVIYVAGAIYRNQTPTSAHRGYRCMDMKMGVSSKSDINEDV